MEITRPLAQVSQHDVAIAGGKGAALGELMKADFSVPPGFVILASVYDHFMVDGVIHDDVRAAIERAFDELGAQYVAVRSSATVEDGATASWAGELETFLHTTKDTLIENVERCWKSLSSERAAKYRQEKGLMNEPISVAVVVQKMVESEVSGVAFSVHPVTEDPNQMIIEAARGLGDRVVSGEITPDAYVLDKNDLSIVEQQLSDENDPCLNFVQTKELAKLVIDIGKHFGFPCDVEWAMAKGKFYILQSRPITTLTN